MGLRDFFGFGGRSNNKNGRIRNVDMSPQEKERVAKLRAGISTALSGETEEKRKKELALTDIPDVAGLAEFNVMMNAYSKYINQSAQSKEQKLETYREMAKFPEIAFAVDEYVDEAAHYDDDGKFLNLDIRSEILKTDDNELIRKTLKAEFNYFFDEIVDIELYFDQWFREYMIDGEIFWEIVFDVDNESKGITRIKKLLTENTFPVWKDINGETDDIEFFAYKGEKEVLQLPRELVGYANSGIYDYSKTAYTDEGRQVLSFLEPARATYKRLKLLEDALVIYRLVRAPERRIFKIDVGNLPKGRAEQFMKELMMKYRQRKSFDPRTGDVTESLDTMAMTEDFWFPVFQGGRSSEVSSLPGGQNLGEIEDVEYFLNKLYRGLKIPKSRFGDENRFSIGDTSGEITREEMKFMKEVKRFTKRFSNALKDLFLMHLKLKGISQDYGIDKQDIGIKINENNLFNRFWEAKILELKFQNFEKFADKIDTDKPLFAKEIIVKKYLEWSDEEYDNNEELLAAEDAAKQAAEGEESSGGGDDSEGGDSSGDAGGGGLF